MLYWLTQRLPSSTRFNVVLLSSLRGILAVSTSLLLSLFIGPAMIRALSRYRSVSRSGTTSQTHLKKAGTPTMGER